MEEFYLGWSSKGSEKFFDRKGHPINLDKWVKLFSETEYKIVKRTNLRDALISTVWLGLDHGFLVFENNSPLIFETIVFDKRKGSKAVLERRYYTEAEALEDHALIVKYIEENENKEFYFA